MPDVLIRSLDSETHAELKRRADNAGVSMQVYVTRLIDEHVRRPTIEDWLHRLDELEPVEGISGEDAVAAARAELP